MKKQSSFILFTSLNKKDLESLTTEVKETIAFGLVEPRQKIFTTADLWSIQRQAKSSLQRRYL